MTRPRRRGLSRELIDQGLGRHYIDVRCEKCRRRWMLLTGTGSGTEETNVHPWKRLVPPATLEQVEYIEPVEDVRPAQYGVVVESVRWSNPWTGKTTDIKPRVRITDSRKPPAMTIDDLHALGADPDGSGPAKEIDERIAQHRRTVEPRYTVQCDPDPKECGRVNVPLTWSTLARKYADAIATGHADIRL